jgi:hypothetical protein
MQVPTLEHFWPAAQLVVPAALHATHRCSLAEQVVMLFLQAPQSLLLLQS